MEEPFTIFQVLPRVAVLFSDGTLLSLGVGGRVLAVEVDAGADFFQFFRDLVCCWFDSVLYFIIYACSVILLWCLTLRRTDIR